ncbi:MAG TPA: hypothetical protein VFZ73_11755 [Gemmatimonadaceae bacterium]
MTRRFLVILALGALPACSDGITEPKCDRCAELRVLTDRAEYRLGSAIAFTLTNRTNAVLRYDWCSVGLASQARDGTFGLRYSPARRCGFGAGTQQVLQHMVVIPAGASVRDSVYGSAVQSVYRLHVWLVQEDGTPETGNPVASNSFDMYPGAAANSTGLTR